MCWVGVCVALALGIATSRLSLFCSWSVVCCSERGSLRSSLNGSGTLGKPSGNQPPDLLAEPRVPRVFCERRDERSEFRYSLTSFTFLVFWVEKGHIGGCPLFDFLDTKLFVRPYSVGRGIVSGSVFRVCLTDSILSPLLLFPSVKALRASLARLL